MPEEIIGTATVGGAPPPLRRGHRRALQPSGLASPGSRPPRPRPRRASPGSLTPRPRPRCAAARRRRRWRRRRCASSRPRPRSRPHAHPRAPSQYSDPPPNMLHYVGPAGPAALWALPRGPRGRRPPPPLQAPLPDRVPARTPTPEILRTAPMPFDILQFVGPAWEAGPWTQDVERWSRTTWGASSP